MSFFKKKYTAEQIAEGLYALCISEDILNASMLFYTKNKGELPEGLRNKIRWQTYALHLFICDYSCFHKFGNSDLKNKILDSFYKQLANNHIGEPNDKQLIKAIISQINSYGDVVRGKSLDDLLVAVGKVYADSVDEPSESLFLIMAGSGIFTQFSVTIKEWLDNIVVVDA